MYTNFEIIITFEIILNFDNTNLTQRTLDIT